MNDFVVQIVRKLSALGVKYTFGSGQNAQVGDTVILYPEAIGATVAAIGVAAGPTVGVRVKKPSGEITINTYDQYGKTGSGGWELVGPGMKPVFVAFSGSAGPGARQVKGVSQLYPPGHAGASANPPGLNQPAKKDPTKITSIRGHLVGDQFGGPGGLNNIVAMTPTANVGPNGMSSIELKAHDEIAVHGRIIDYTATPIYSAPHQTNAPESISVTFSVRDVMGKPVGSGQSATVPNYI